MKKVLFVLTSHENLEDTGRKTGFWIEEFASPYYHMEDNDIKVNLSSPKGGQAPIVFKNVKTEEGYSLVKGKKVISFTNSEESAMGLDQMVPFLVENELKRNGGIFTKGDNWQSHAVEDGLLITGQNPASSLLVAQLLLNKLKNK